MDAAELCEYLEVMLARHDGVEWVEAEQRETAMLVHLENGDSLRVEVQQ